MKFNKVPKNNHVFCYRLYPSEEQKRTFTQYFGATRFIWNWALTERERQREIRRGWSQEIKDARSLQKTLNKKLPKNERVYFDDDISVVSQNRSFTKLRNNPEYSWLKKIDSLISGAVINDLDEAYKHSYRRLKEGKRGKAVGWPKIKKKSAFSKKSFTTRGCIKLLPNTKKIISGTATVTCRALQIPIIGKVWINVDREPIGTLAKVTIKKTKSGKYYAVILATTPLQDVHIDLSSNKNPKIVGLNCGLRRFAPLDSGELINNPEYYGHVIDRLRYLNRKISRLERYRKRDKNGKTIDAPSKALIKANKRYNKHMAKVVDKRERYAHHISKRIVNDFDVIALETWSPAKLIQQNTKALSFRIADAGWGQLRRQIEYKAKKFGKTVIKLDEFEPLTKIHHKCGNLLNIKYSSALTICQHCNEKVDIDVNAAINGKNKASEMLPAILEEQLRMKTFETSQITI